GPATTRHAHSPSHWRIDRLLKRAGASLLREGLPRPPAPIIPGRRPPPTAELAAGLGRVNRGGCATRAVRGMRSGVVPPCKASDRRKPLVRNVFAEATAGPRRIGSADWPAAEARL